MVVMSSRGSSPCGPVVEVLGPMMVTWFLNVVEGRSVLVSVKIVSGCVWNGWMARRRGGLRW